MIFYYFWTNLGLIPNIFYATQKSKAQLLLIYDQNRHHRSDNYIKIPIDVGLRK